MLLMRDSNCCRTFLEIGCNLYIVLFVLVIVLGLVILSLIISKHCIEYKKISQECNSRNLMYDMFAIKNKEEKFDIEIIDEDSVKKYTIQVKRKEK